MMRVFEAATAPVSIVEIARCFAQGKQIEKRVGLAPSRRWPGLGICLRRMAARPFRCEAPHNSKLIFVAPSLRPPARLSVVASYGPWFGGPDMMPVTAYPEGLQGRFDLNEKYFSSGSYLGAAMTNVVAPRHG